jgi:hypothetical protein
MPGRTENLFLVRIIEQSETPYENKLSSQKIEPGSFFCMDESASSGLSIAKYMSRLQTPLDSAINSLNG